jgi:hypothetical protein
MFTDLRSKPRSCLPQITTSTRIRSSAPVSPSVNGPAHMSCLPTVSCDRGNKRLGTRPSNWTSWILWRTWGGMGNGAQLSLLPRGESPIKG